MKVVDEKDIETVLYKEWFTHDSTQDDTVLQAMNIWVVIGNVGGIQQVLLLLAAFVFSQYSELSF